MTTREQVDALIAAGRGYHVHSVYKDVEHHLRLAIRGLKQNNTVTRRTLFHLGALWRLNDLGYLPRLDRLWWRVEVG